MPPSSPYSLRHHHHYSGNLRPVVLVMLTPESWMTLRGGALQRNQALITMWTPDEVSALVRDQLFLLCLYGGVLNAGTGEEWWAGVHTFTHTATEVRKRLPALSEQKRTSRFLG